jgi:hypothetical protein
VTTLYVANCSKQIEQFLFRRPESRFTSPPQEIPPGEQRAVIKDGTQAEVDAVIAHHSIYGMLPEAEAFRSKRRFRLCYSVDKPVSEKGMRMAFERNDKLLKDDGQTARDRTAAAVAGGLDESLQKSGAAGRASVGAVEVELVEQVKPGQAPGLNEGIEVVKPGRSSRRNGRERSK